LLHKSIVIPGKLVAIPPEADQPQAEASATRNPGISKASGYRLSPVWRTRDVL